MVTGTVDVSPENGPDNRLQLTFMGAPKVVLDGDEIGSELRRKAVALLVYLAVEDRSHTREGLAGLLWPDYPQASALAYLRRTLWELTSNLGQEWFAIDRRQASFDWTAAAWLDCRAFREMAQTGIAGHDLSSLAEAAQLFQDNFLAGFSLPDAPDFDSWQGQMRQKFDGRLAQVLEKLADGYQELRAFDQALAVAERRLTLDPLHEATHRQLMRLYVQAGERAAALRQYEQCRQTLAGELGVEPAAETTALWQQIRDDNEGLATGRGQAVHDIRTTDPARDSQPEQASMIRLPAAPTPFIGRENELAELAALLADPSIRLMSLVGPGGIGKTRLAMEAARQATRHFPDGVLFLQLAPLNDPADILPLLAKSLDVNFY